MNPYVKTIALSLVQAVEVEFPRSVRNYACHDGGEHPLDRGTAHLFAERISDGLANGNEVERIVAFAMESFARKAASGDNPNADFALIVAEIDRIRAECPSGITPMTNGDQRTREHIMDSVAGV